MRHPQSWCQTDAGASPVLGTEAAEGHSNTHTHLQAGQKEGNGPASPQQNIPLLAFPEGPWQGWPLPLRQEARGGPALFSFCGLLEAFLSKTKSVLEIPGSAVQFGILVGIFFTRGLLWSW